MSIFGKNKKEGSSAALETASVQTAGKNCHPFGFYGGYSPLAEANGRIYRSLREGIPIIDSAINKIVRLMGGFELDCKNEQINDDMNKFLSCVNVGGNQQGIQSFVDNFMNQLLTYGSAIGEIVADEHGFYALYNGELGCVNVKRAENDLDLIFCSGHMSGSVPFKYQDRILFSVLNPEPNEILGTSLLRGLPFVSDILLKIYNTIGTNWQRLGNLRYAVTYKPQGDGMDKAFAKERAN